MKSITILSAFAAFLLTGCNQQQPQNQPPVAEVKRAAEPEFYALLHRGFNLDLDAVWEIQHPKQIDKSTPKAKADFIAKIKSTPTFGWSHCDKPTYYLENPPVYEGDYAHVKQTVKCGDTLMRTGTINMHKYEGKWYWAGMIDITVYIDPKAGKLKSGK